MRFAIFGNGKMGFTALGLRFNHWERDKQFQNDNCSNEPGFVQKIVTIFPGLFKDYSRTKLNFQGPPTRGVI